MNKSEAAFVFSAERLFEENERVYFWTFTFQELMPDWYYSRVWSEFVNRLGNYYGGSLRGIKVVELHQSHGIHYHVLFSERVPVAEVRRLAQRVGIGRVHVRRADRGAIPYLRKYLAKQFKGEHRLHGACARWGTVGGFRGCRVRDVEVNSTFHTVLRRAQQLCGRKQLPYAFVDALYRHRFEDAWRIENACRRFVDSGGKTSNLFGDTLRWTRKSGGRQHLAALKVAGKSAMKGAA